MNNSPFFLACLGLLLSLFTIFSCSKSPKACIDPPSSRSIEVYKQIELTSCSEDAYYIEWFIQQEVGSTDLTYQGNETTLSWNSPGNYIVELTAFDKKRQESDSKEVTVKVSDVCYSCENYNKTQLKELCASTENSIESLLNQVTDLEEGDWECRKN